MRQAEHVNRRIKLRHLNVLHAVAQRGSMAKAAEQLAISQPVVSKAIAELEQMLGVRLFDRGPQGVELTLYGRSLLKRSIGIFDDLRTAVAEIEFLADPTAGELRIGTTEPFAAGLVADVIEILSRRHPRIAFHIFQSDPVALVDRELRERRVELAIGRLPALARDDDFETTVLFHDRLVAVCGAQSDWARRRKIHLSELVDEPWCVPPPESPVGSQFIAAFRAAGLEPPRHTVTGFSFQLTASLVTQGRFLAMFGESILRFTAKRLSMKALPVDLQVPRWPAGIVVLKDRTISPVAQLFIDCTRAVVERSIKQK